MTDRTYVLIFYPPDVKEEILAWASDLDVKIEEKKLTMNNDNGFLHLAYECITFLHAEDELAFKLKFQSKIPECDD